MAFFPLSSISVFGFRFDAVWIVLASLVLSGWRCRLGRSWHSVPLFAGCSVAIWLKFGSSGVTVGLAAGRAVRHRSPCLVLWSPWRQMVSHGALEMTAPFTGFRWVVAWLDHQLPERGPWVQARALALSPRGALPLPPRLSTAGRQRGESSVGSRAARSASQGRRPRNPLGVIGLSSVLTLHLVMVAVAAVAPAVPRVAEHIVHLRRHLRGLLPAWGSHAVAASSALSQAIGSARWRLA